MDDKTRADFWEAIAEAREESNQKFIQAVRDVAKHGIKREEYETLQARIKELETVLAVRNATEYTFPITYAELCELAEKVPLPGSPFIADCVKWLTAHLPKLIEDSKKADELEARNAELEREVAGYKAKFGGFMKSPEETQKVMEYHADAELGRLVRAMPPGVSVGIANEFCNPRTPWFCNNGKNLQFAETPEAALKAAGIGKEPEPIHSPE